MRFMPFWSELLQAAGDLIFPQACCACDRAIASRQGPWCGACGREMAESIAGDYCPRCGLRVGPGLLDAAGCSECRSSPHRLDGIARVGSYHGKAGELLKRFKFARQHRLDGLLGELLAAAVRGRQWSEELDALVPVPTDWHGWLRYRGHPAGLLAAEMGRRLSLPSLPLLRLAGKKRRQTELSNSDRPHNVRNVFALRKHANVAGARLCIVDDVSTTGATVREIARILRAGGAAEVYAAVVCKTDHGRSDAFG